MGNDVEGAEFEIREEEAFEVKPTFLYYTRAPRYDQQNPRNKRRNRTSAVEQAVLSWKKGPSSLERLKRWTLTHLER